MLFHEIYSTYFQTVAKILAEAVEHPLTTEEISAIIQDYAFEESILNIPKSLGMAHWQLLKEDGTTILRKNPTMPLTILQKRWINAIALDPRIRLFTDQPVVFSDVEPLFLPEDIYVFDKYSDGDPYENPEYIQNFRLILDAIKHQYPIQISITNRHGKRITTRTIPEYLEYVDMILIMSVHPGAGGQKFMEESLDRIRETRKMIEESGKEIDIQVDGGVKFENARKILDAGANILVAGSAVFGDNIVENTRKFVEIFRDYE